MGSQFPLSVFKKSVIAVVKLKTFDIELSVNDNGLDGYEKPKRAHTAKTMNIPDRETIVDFDRFVKGDNRRRDIVETSTRNRGRKNSRATNRGAFVLPITIRSNGSSNIIGAAAVPTNALPKATFRP